MPLEEIDRTQNPGWKSAVRLECLEGWIAFRGGSGRSIAQRDHRLHPRFVQFVLPKTHFSSHKRVFPPLPTFWGLPQGLGPDLPPDPEFEHLSGDELVTQMEQLLESMTLMGGSFV